MKLIRKPLGFLLLTLLCAGTALGAAEKPNFVIFLSDDHGYLDSTVYGATDVKTPNMQRLAAAGLTFTHMFVASPACAPSRAAMLTGRMPARNGAEANHALKRSDVRSLIEDVKAMGYDVAAFGKVAHYNHDRAYGFEAHHKEYDAKVVATFLDGRDRSRPLCLFVGTHEPHVPWPENRGYDGALLHLPPTHVDTPETRRFRAHYYTDVTKADTLLEEIYDLARRQLDPKKTLFVYTSDHGAQWPFGKWNLYDAGIRVPFMAVWDGVIQPGATTAAMASWIDLLPTLLELAGGSAPRDLDGRSFAAVLRQATAPHRDKVFSTHTGDGNMNVYPIRALRTADWKYILNLHPEYQHATHINRAQGRDGLIYWRSWEAAAQTNAQAAALVRRYRQRPREELYDVRSDPHEQRNLAGDAKHTGRLRAMRAELEQWLQTHGDERRVTGKPLLLSEPAVPIPPGGTK